MLPHMPYLSGVVIRTHIRHARSMGLESVHQSQEAQPAEPPVEVASDSLPVAGVSATVPGQCQTLP